MLGFLAMMLVMLALISAGGYWISWDLQDKASRMSFMAKAGNDLAALWWKCRYSVHITSSKPTASARPTETKIRRVDGRHGTSSGVPTTSASSTAG